MLYLGWLCWQMSLEAVEPRTEHLGLQTSLTVKGKISLESRNFVLMHEISLFTLKNIGLSAYRTSRLTNLTHSQGWDLTKFRVNTRNNSQW